MIIKILGLVILVASSYQRIIPVYEEPENAINDKPLPVPRGFLPSLPSSQVPTESLTQNVATQKTPASPIHPTPLKVVQPTPLTTFMPPTFIPKAQIVPQTLPYPTTNKVAYSSISYPRLGISQSYPAYPSESQLEYNDHPKYEFSYGVEDHYTGDIHSQKESRDGDKVHGQYSLREADGSIRIVKYTSDKHSGFNTIVQSIGKSTNNEQYKNIITVAAPEYHHF